MGLIAQAFSKDESLHRKILQAINEKPSQQTLFDDIATYHLRHSQPAANETPNESADEPAAKKRKLANGSVPIHGAGTRSALVLELREISFSIPQRKKLHFRVVQYTSSDGPDTLGVQAVNPANDAVEYEISSADIAQVLRTPVPEKATKQYNYIFVPSTASSSEPVLFTVPATPPKGGTFTFPSSTTNLDDALSQVLQQQGLSLTVPDEKEFASATPESHRKSEKAYHVKAFRGSKDGFLFFLSNGIFFGFKKPLFFLALEDIESISYTSVLQRTFNLNIAYRKPGSADGEEEEIEFSMLDQSDYSGINDYIQRHGLNDASLAAGRRAQSETKKKTGPNSTETLADAETGEDDGRTELEKAEQQLQDEEDEMEEDFEPSDDDDDGSGSEEDSDDDSPAKRKPAKDLVEEELGSEAEDVEVTDDEEGVEEDDEEEEDEDVDEDVEQEHSEQAKPPAVKPAPPLAQPAPVQGRWGAPVRRTYEPDPEDDDQL